VRRASSALLRPCSSRASSSCRTIRSMASMRARSRWNSAA
jgi:hypothetical protein